MPVGSWKTKHWDWIGGATVYIVNGSDRGGTTGDQKQIHETVVTVDRKFILNILIWF